MKSRGKTGRRPADPLERRRDELTAMFVDVALIYRQVFGLDASLQYVVLARIKAEVAARIFQDRCRRRPFQS
jgi:hypothetical protein